MSSRSTVLDIMRGWIGATPGSPAYYDILNIYNSADPLPRGYALKPGDAYCAATVSAAWIRAGLGGQMPIECSCTAMMWQAQRMGMWIEDDGYRPEPGDCIIYDWQDSGAGDNRGDPDHIGMVERVSGNRITVIEGNMGSAHKVGRRSITRNGRYIRGYITPDYGNGRPQPAQKQEVEFVYLPTLYRQTKSGYVKTAQILLNKYNAAGLEEDGIFGSATEKAVRKYQESRGLSVDGIIGPKTWTRLLK